MTNLASHLTVRFLDSIDPRRCMFHVVIPSSAAEGGDKRFIVWLAFIIPKHALAASFYNMFRLRPGYLMALSLKDSDLEIQLEDGFSLFVKVTQMSITGLLSNIVKMDSKSYGQAKQVKIDHKIKKLGFDYHLLSKGTVNPHFFSTCHFDAFDHTIVLFIDGI